MNEESTPLPEQPHRQIGDQLDLEVELMWENVNFRNKVRASFKDNAMEICIVSVLVLKPY